MARLRLRELPDERQHRDLKDKLERGIRRTEDQIKELSKLVLGNATHVSQSTPDRSTTAAQTPRTPSTTKMEARGTPVRAGVGGFGGGGGQGRRRSQMQLLSASGRKSRTFRSRTNETPTENGSRVGLWTPDVSLIGADVKGSPLGPLGDNLNSYPSPAMPSMSVEMSSLLNATASGKASRLFAASAHGPLTGTLADAEDPDPVEDELRKEMRSSLAAVQADLEEQKILTRRLTTEVRRLQQTV